MKTKISHLTKEFVPGEKTLVGIKVETGNEKFTIPVVDVRTSDRHRERVEEIIKQSNISRGSKFFNPSYSGMGYSYNLSMKK